MKILAFTCVRNEGPFVLEWIAYNRLIGVTDFVIFSNDCDDGTDLLLDRLAEAGIIRHVRHKATEGKSVQWQALQKVDRLGLTSGFDWAMFLDVDEFPAIHAGGRRLADAIAAMPQDAEAIAMPWRLFGANGQARFVDRPVTEQFLRSAPPALDHPIAGRYIKTLYRPDRFQKPGVHRPKRMQHGKLPLWYDGAGMSLGEDFAQRDSQIALPTLDAGRSIIELNHYSLRSVESFVVKSDRGLANRRVKRIDLSYWVERNFNTVENLSMAYWSAPLTSEIAALSALEGIADLHRHSCDWHHRRCVEIIRTPAGYRLFCDCLHAVNSAPVPRGLAMHLYRLFAELGETNAE